jgi:HD superfamily phosphohydrolase
VISDSSRNELVIERLQSAIDEFVDAHLPHSVQSHDDGKIIHEAIWGTHLYNAPEIVILDTPLLQRLRRIHQTGLAYFTFPTAVHSRFDHTLGTINMCSRIAEELEKKPECKSYIKGLKRDIRLAALLHDCGHGTFSHTSEEIYGTLPEIQSLLTNDPSFTCGPASHEILSCLIIMSQPFRTFLQKAEVDCEPDILRKYIMGNELKTKKYKSDILNSIFDGDKIDYIHRDAHFSGLSLKVDLDRLWYGINIKDIPIDGKIYRKLSISHTAAEPLEQIIFHRAMLSPTLYQHQKVRAADCMFKSVIEYINHHQISLTIRGKSINFQKPEDFLWCTDDDFWGIAENASVDDWVRRRVRDISERKLFHRALTIATHTINDKNSGLAKLLELRVEGSPKANKALRRIAGLIHQEVIKKGINLEPEDIWVDLPKQLRVGKDIEEAYIFSNVGSNFEFTPAKDYFPVDRWAHQIGIHKWEGHIFCPEAVRDLVSPIAARVLESEFNFSFRKAAFTESHVQLSV